MEKNKNYVKIQNMHYILHNLYQYTFKPTLTSWYIYFWDHIKVAGQQYFNFRNSWKRISFLLFWKIFKSTGHLLLFYEQNLEIEVVNITKWNENLRHNYQPSKNSSNKRQWADQRGLGVYKTKIVEMLAQYQLD